MASNLYDAVMELERLKRDSTPEAIKERAEAKAAQLVNVDAITAELQAQAVNPFIQAPNPQAKTERRILAYFKGRQEPAHYTAAIMQLLKTDPEIEAIADADTGEIIWRAQPC